MAAAITTTATTLEAQLIEVAQAVLAEEQGIAAEERPNRIGLAIDTEALQANVSFNVDVTVGGSGGVLSYEPVSYLA